MHLAAQFAQGLRGEICRGGSQHALHRPATHRHNDFRLQQRHLALKVSAALRQLLGMGVAFVRHTAFEHRHNHCGQLATGGKS